MTNRHDSSWNILNSTFSRGTRDNINETQEGGVTCDTDDVSTYFTNGVSERNSLPHPSGT